MWERNVCEWFLTCMLVSTHQGRLTNDNCFYKQKQTIFPIFFCLTIIFLFDSGMSQHLQCTIRLLQWHSAAPVCIRKITAVETRFEYVAGIILNYTHFLGHPWLYLFPKNYLSTFWSHAINTAQAGWRFTNLIFIPLWPSPNFQLFDQICTVCVLCSSFLVLHWLLFTQTCVSDPKVEVHRMLESVTPYRITVILHGMLCTLFLIRMAHTPQQTCTAWWCFRVFSVPPRSPQPQLCKAHWCRYN